MKRNSKFVIMALLASAALLFSGCTREIKPYYTITEHVPNADRYQTSDHEFSEKIKKLEISYSSDDVNVIAYDGDTIKVEEEVHGEYPEEARMYWLLDGEKLRILSHKPGVSLTLNLSGDHYKILRVYVPKSVSLEDLDVSISSGDIKASGFTAERANFEASSGGIFCEDAVAGHLEASSSSGGIYIKNTEAETMDVGTSSGESYLECAVKDLNIESSSGDMTLKFTKLPEKLDASGSSAEITLILPKGASFKAEISTSSGDFESDIALKKDGNLYIAGDGDAEFDLSTSSGDIMLREE